MQIGRDNLHHANLGALAATNMTAEIYGVIFGILWVLQSPHLSQLSLVHFHIDNEAAGDFIIGQAQPTENTELVHIGKALALVLRQYTELTWEHVYSHTGVPWNEFIDTVVTSIGEGADQGVYDFAQLSTNNPITAWITTPSLAPLGLPVPLGLQR